MCTEMTTSLHHRALQDDIERVLIDADTIQARIRELGKEIAGVYRGQDLLLISVLKGSIVEDIIDSGNTLNYLVRILQERQPASLRIVTLLDKPERREVETKVDWVGFSIPNDFVVGYGLDYNELYRNLPYIGVLKPEVYTPLYASPNPGADPKADSEANQGHADKQPDKDV